MSYAAGARVRVADRSHQGHHRTPGYVKGKTGTVERVHQSFRNPETRAYGSDGLPPQRLYLVGFDHADVWGGYRRRASERLYLDIFEHWLEPVE